MSEIMVVTIACPDAEGAQQLARGLVESRLVACVQIHPIRSTYRWQGEIETSDEYLLTAKTTTEVWPALEAYILAHHPYDVPEIIAQRVEFVTDSYARWVRENVTAK